MYIFDTSSKNPEIYQVDPRVCERLPKFTGQYRLDKTTVFTSHIFVRRKGSMDTTLWSEFNEEVILPCYPNVSKKVQRCPITHKILSGPLIIKTDAGPGRLAKEAVSWEFHEWMNERGVVILLGLPNGTSANQEMDQGYRDLKHECEKSTQRVASGKMAARVLTRKKAASRTNQLKWTRSCQQGRPGGISRQ